VGTSRGDAHGSAYFYRNLFPGTFTVYSQLKDRYRNVCMYVCFILPLGLQAAKNYFIQNRGQKYKFIYTIEKKIREGKNEKMLLNPL
jgi:hypothetical protein